MRPSLIIAASVLALVAGCSESTTNDQAYTEEAVASSPSPMDPAATAESPAVDAVARSAQGTGSSEVPDAQLPQLAYSYAYTLEAPTREIAGLAARHEQACVQAGPQRCQVIGSSTQSYGQDDQRATLEIRAEPGWLAGFRNSLATDAQAADGRIADSSTSSEDLTRSIIDTEAHLRAKTALRDRLQTMLATRDGNLQSVLEVERELARVQAEIDSATSTLEVMRARVSMSALTLTYQSSGVLAPDSATAPLQSALNNALGIFMTGLAAIVTILAFALPFLLVLGPLIWLVLRALRRRRLRRAADTANSPES